MTQWKMWKNELFIHVNNIYFFKLKAALTYSFKFYGLHEIQRKIDSIFKEIVAY